MDIFEDLRDKMNYEKNSDLRIMSRNVERNLDSVLLQIDPEEYSPDQWQDLSRYLFPYLKVPLPSDSTKLRNNIIMATVDYRLIINRISRNHH